MWVRISSRPAPRNQPPASDLGAVTSEGCSVLQDATFLTGCKTPLQSFLGIAEQHGGPQNGVSVGQGCPLVGRYGGGSGEGLEGVLLSMPARTSFPRCPRPRQPHSGSGDGSGPVTHMAGLASEAAQGSWAPPYAVQTLITQTLSRANPTAITAEEYFNPNFELGNRDMGRPMELTTKTQK